MIRFLVKRILQGVIVLLIVTLAVYAMFFAGDPDAIAHRLAGRQATPEQVHNVLVRLGLDRPFWTQYFSFLWKLLHGNLGTDFLNDVPVTSVLKQAAPITISLAAGAAVIWLIIGISTGVYSSIRPRSFLDRAFTALALFFYSIPTFVLGLTLILIFFYELTVHHVTTFFPAAGYVGITSSPYQWMRHMILPWMTLALISAAAYTRLSRTSMLEVLGEDYIRTARSKGLPERRVIIVHGLRSALTPVVTQFGIDFATVLGGAILTEKVFSLPGLGYTAYNSIENQDLNVIVGIVIIAATAIVVANILVDMVYAVLDPRVRLR
jgi:peptide/nickel transport system permease protein